MEAHVLEMLITVETEFNEILKNPEAFFKSHSENTNRIKELSQKAYAIAISDKNFKGRSLSKLFIDGFDEEQVWQQSDLLNNAARGTISEFVRSFNPNDILSSISKNREAKSVVENSCTQDSEKRDTENADSLFSEESSAEEGYAFDDDSDSPAEIGSDKKINKLSQQKSTYSSAVDDQFFKLSKLENFLRLEDIKEERGDVGASDDEINLFQDIPSDDFSDSDDDSVGEKDKAKKSSRDIMYDGFFDAPDSEIGDENDNGISDEDDNLLKDSADYSFDESESDEEKLIEKNEINNQDVHLETDTKSVNKQKTAFELDQEKIKKKIQEYESSLLKPLPWHLTGEVAANSRPIDSLIHQETEFDSNTKQDLLVDKALTEKIEEITIMAIRNKAFFDVERKYKPTEEDIHFKKKVALEQTKSKKSLAEVYEEDYLKKQTKQEEEKENPKHVEIKKLMDSLFPQLHALFSYIPKPALPEIKIVSNLPAVIVEEVAPTSISNATLLAPEEVKKKTGLVKGQTERTDTDRKRERRKKKIHQKLKEKKRLEKLESRKQNPSAKISKLEKVQTLKKLKQHKNTKIAAIDEGGKIKSSKDFFSRLQDTMDTKNKTENSHKKRKIK